MKKTKIICTIGPASYTKEVLRGMIENGMDIVRINLSHADRSFCEMTVNNIRELNKELNKKVAIMFDTKGPGLRIGKLKTGQVNLEKGTIIRIINNDLVGDKTSFSFAYNGLLTDKIKPNDKILINDGLIELTVIKIDELDIVCLVETGGLIRENMGVNIPHRQLEIPFLAEADIEDIKLATEMKVDFLALSFVSSAMDVLEINDLLVTLNNDHIGIISKIETVGAILDIDAIIKLSEGVMIARGDLGVEIPLEKIPNIQKEIVEKCFNNNKISIVATEMLASMQENKRPTRAEVSDVANAVLDGVDAVMLSGETTIGHYPIETVNIMKRIIESTEEDINYVELLNKKMEIEKQDITTAIAYSVVDTALRLKPKAIVVSTKSGYTAKKISGFRPNVPILAMSPNEDTIYNLALNWGVYPILVPHYNSTDDIVNKAKEIAKQMMALDTKDIIIITGGFPMTKIKHTNFMKVEEI